MILGEPNLFGVKYEVDENPTEHLFGKMSYWVGGYEVGDYTMGTSLRDIAYAASQLLKYKGLRYDYGLMRCTSIEAFNTLDNAMYVDNGQSADVMRRAWEYYSVFHALPIGCDIFDCWKGYLIEDARECRFIFKANIENSTLTEVNFSLGRFDAVLTLFIEAINTIR